MVRYICILLLLLSGNELFGQVIKITTPDNNIIGDPVHIKLQDCKPFVQYKLVSTIVDERRRKWQSYIYFTADKQGSFDLNSNAPDSGTYQGVDQLGIFWSAGLDATSKASSPADYPSDSSLVTFEIYLEGTLVAEKKLMRWFTTSSVTKKEIREKGIAGTLYTPQKPLNKCIILVGGSGGGILWQRVTAGVLASKGYTCLALAYFRFEDLPKAINKIPIEYIEDAIKYTKSISANPEITLMGWSKGAEYVLSASSYLTGIDKVIAFSPAHAVFERIEEKTEVASSWTYNNKELPFVLWSTTIEKGRSGELNWIEALKDTVAVETARIKIENSRAKILLLSGDKDIIWPSKLMAEAVERRATQMRKKELVKHISFIDAGHAITRPGYLPTTLSPEQGGTAKGNAYAQFKAWNEVLNFLQ